MNFLKIKFNMKKLLLTAAAVFAFGFANAQEGGFAKGDAFISGTVAFSNTKMGDVKADTYQLSPAVGYFVTENIALGLGVNFAKSEMEFEGNDVEVKSTGASVGASYFFTPSKPFSLLAGLGVSYNKADVAGVDLNTFGVALAPGFNYFISKNFAVNANIGVLGYTSQKFDVDGAEATNTFALGLNGSNLNFGLTYKF